jgi:hypothetical protein
MNELPPDDLAEAKVLAVMEMFRAADATESGRHAEASDLAMMEMFRTTDFTESVQEFTASKARR